MKPLHELGAAALAPRLASREISAEALALSCLERMESREPAVRAFAHLNAKQVLTEARALDQGAVRGPLHGLPVGVKDVIDTADFPTEYGSPIYRGHQPAADAACVAIARACGALVLGKTVTTEFATFPPGPTANPRNPAHTPGGSSSGSAAAVADRMVPLAFGTQTSGSIIRPAAFCGAVGYKPTYGTLARVGVKQISDSLDTVGAFARSVEDVALFVSALSGRAFQIRNEEHRFKFAICLTPQWPAALPETQHLFEELPGRLSTAGAHVGALSLPAPFDGLAEAQGVIWDFEMARCLADEYRRFPDLIRERLRQQLAGGWKIPPERYDAARALARACRQLLQGALGDFDALVVPSATGEAPAGLEATGDPVFNRIWSLLHTPAVHVPTSQGPDGLPIGVQVVGRIGDDARVLACAHWIQNL